MKGKLFLVMAAGLAFGLSSPSAIAGAKGDTNEYFVNSTAGTASTVTVERSQTLGSSGSVMIEKTLSSPAVIEGSDRAPVIIEDRIIKQKHLFSIGIWPLFDFEIL